MKKRFFLLSGIFIIAVVFSFIFFAKYSFYCQRRKIFNNLKIQIASHTNQFKGKYSLIIKDLSFKSLSLSFNRNKKVAAASLIKLPLAAVAFKAIGENRISFSDAVIIKKGDISLGSGIIKTMKSPLKLSIKELLELMIVSSDNTATNKLIETLGFDYINKSFKELGLRATVLERKMMDFSQRKNGIENYTSASDITFLLEKVYDRKLISQRFSDFLLALLLKQKIKDRLARYLPKNAKIAHKTGLERRVIHDAGIVYAPRGDYIICILTEGAKMSIRAKKFIAQISLLTYNLYQADSPSLFEKIVQRKIKVFRPNFLISRRLN